MPASPTRVMFSYWGRRGMTAFALECGEAARAENGIEAAISVSRQNESFERFQAFGPALFPVDTFGTHLGAVGRLPRVFGLRRRLVERLRRDRTQAVIELMPHLWSPFVMPAVQAAGIRFATIVHDAEPHPGDHRTALVQTLLRRAARQADVVLTLSEAVGDRIVDLGLVERGRVRTVFHPDLSYGASRSPDPPGPGEPLRLVFLGRIMPYKGLPLFLDTVELLRREGTAVEAGIFGEGALDGETARRIAGFRATLVNRWLSADEIAAILARCHAVVLSHTEASQSGVAAAAFAAGTPVVATPVGGLREQVGSRGPDMVATRADAPALAEAVRSLLLDPGRYRSACAAIRKTAGARSMEAFVRECVRLAAA